ncbi:hypothetical protein [Clostridium sp. BNL1100]|uniref:hypothetical protein n=1 Tax=Clostridium sp. BNL1100 TaxID=755731 RepID=UPI00024A7417|nr:hypothetical protein [Clostridium sp. BNL1100]AEY67272.1 hypothetical protein Clo1100_3125 [Clostridium sp. BNL1100]
MTCFVKTTRDFIDYLKVNKNVDLEERCFNEEYTDISDEDLIETISMFKSINFSLKKEYYDFFRISSMSFAWSFTNEKNQFIYGGFLFNGILDLFIQDSDFWDLSNSINQHKPNEGELEFLKKLNWFEKQSWGDDGRFGCFLREAGDFPPRIYFYDNSAYFPMNLSLEEYFGAMIASCAVRGWQYFYVDIPDKFPEFVRINKSTVLKDVELAVELLPELFPDRDFSYHIGRMDYLKSRLK